MLTLNRIVILNIALVFTHQVDAAFWHEWDMFGLPGGIQLFNIFNLVIFVVVLACFVQVIQRSPAGFRCSFVIAALSGIVMPIHAILASMGLEQFNLPVSLFLIAATFVVSAIQIILTYRARAEFGGA
jgi:hypothetical protein